MKLSVACPKLNLQTQEFGPLTDLRHLKHICQEQSGILSSHMILLHNGIKLLDDAKTLLDLGVKDGDIVIVQDKCEVGLDMPINNGENLPTNDSSEQDHECAQDVTMWTTASLRRQSFITQNLNKALGSKSLLNPPSCLLSNAPIQCQVSTLWKQSHPFDSRTNCCGQMFSVPLQPQTYIVAPAHKTLQSSAYHDPAYVRELLLKCPDQLALLKQNNPRLSEALNTGRLEPFAKVSTSTLLNYYVSKCS